MDVQMLLNNPYVQLFLWCAIGSCVLSFVALIISLKSKSRITKMLGGKQSRDIDEILVQIYKNISKFEQFTTTTTQSLGTMQKHITDAIQSTETIRFNPFKGMGAGGNQSFATAFIDRKGNGLILSSLYASERVSVYAKPVESFVSTYELTEEERIVLERAKEKLSNEQK